MNYQRMLARRTGRMGASAIREILKVVAQPGMISLAGGIPAPESFPLGLIEHLTRSVLAKYGAAALQYDPSEGFGPLREVLAEYAGTKGVRAGPESILVSSGSQGMLDALGMALISRGDRIAVEAPTYLGALQAFTPYEPEYVHVDTDEQGVIPESLEQVLRRGPVKFVYLVPTFQNPTGRTLGLARRKTIAQLAQEYDTLIVEDDPYSALRLRGDALPPLYSFAPEHVVYVSTLSKVFAPGLRIGFCVAPEELRRWLVIVKQGIDLHTCTFSQALAAEYLSGGHLASHLPRIIEIYRPRHQAMLDALQEHFPGSYTWSRPEGGMFVWVEGPRGTDMQAIYRQAVKRKVAFVPGTYFYAHPCQGLETMRLNYTMADETVLKHAIATLADVVCDAVVTAG